MKITLICMQITFITHQWRSLFSCCTSCDLVDRKAAGPIGPQVTVWRDLVVRMDQTQCGLHTGYKVKHTDNTTTRHVRVSEYNTADNHSTRSDWTMLATYSVWILRLMLWLQSILLFYMHFSISRLKPLESVADAHDQKLKPTNLLWSQCKDMRSSYYSDHQ